MRFWNKLGPGLLYAGAAIGVSHIVQSTRAGASFGFDLFFAVLLINLLKYPFFVFAPKYVIATGKHLLFGYSQIGRWAAIGFLMVTAITVFPILAAITSVTVGVILQVTALNINFTWAYAFLSTIILVVVGVGRFNQINQVVKIMIALLTIITFLAVIFAFTSQPTLANNLPRFKLNSSGLFFLVFLAGWMPTPIDASVWQSLWNLADKDDQKTSPSNKAIIRDFNVGYAITTLTALAFLALGALIIYPLSISLPENSVAFAGLFIANYSSVFGSWVQHIIGFLAVIAMLSTLITVSDAYPRVFKAGLETLKPNSRLKFDKIQNTLALFVMLSGGFLLANFFKGNMLKMVDFATAVSFLSAPFQAFLNYKLLFNNNLPIENRPNLFIKVWAICGLVFLSTFAIAYLYILMQ